MAISFRWVHPILSGQERYALNERGIGQVLVDYMQGRFDTRCNLPTSTKELIHIIETDPRYRGYLRDMAKSGLAERVDSSEIYSN